MRRVFQLTLFISIFSLFLGVANVIVYQALAQSFTLTNPLHLTMLGFALFILSGSFILSMILGMYYYNLFTRTYCTISATWVGIFVYLFFASVVIGLLTLAQINIQTINIITISLAVVTSLYGILHARSITISKIQVALENIPASWVGKTMVFVSDLHLGQLRGSTFAKKVTQKINELHPDVVCIGGDLFDGTQAPDPKFLTSPLKNLYAPLGIFYVTGNHEEFGDETIFLEAVRSQNIRILANELVLIEGVQLVGVDYRAAAHTDAFRKILKDLSIDTTKPSILIKHEPKDLAVSEEAGISLQLSGHTHKAQIWPFVYIAQSTYKGFAYGLKVLKTLQVYTSSGVGTWGPPVRVGTNSEVVLITFIKAS